MKDEPQQSEWHDDVSLMRRINIHLEEANLACLSYDYFNWFQNLNIVFTELSPLLNMEDNATGETFQNTIHTLINREIVISKGSQTSHSCSFQLYNQLHLYRLFIGRCHKRTGLLLKEKEDYLAPQTR
jgi:hypothetical protein